MVFNTIVAFYLLELLRSSYFALCFGLIYNIRFQFVYEKELARFRFICACVYMCANTRQTVCICVQIEDRLFISMAGSISESWCCWISSVIRIERVNYYHRHIFLPMTFLFLLRIAGYLFPAGE